MSVNSDIVFRTNYDFSKEDIERLHDWLIFAAEDELGTKIIGDNLTLELFPISPLITCNLAFEESGLAVRLTADLKDFENEFSQEELQRLYIFLNTCSCRLFYFLKGQISEQLNYIQGDLKLFFENMKSRKIERLIKFCQTGEFNET